MALVIEDGTIVLGANSYVTLTIAREYALARGVTLPSDDSALEALLLLAMDYLESKRGEYQGSKTDPLNQELQWPRIGVYIDCSPIDANVIPKELKNAQIQLAIESNAGVTLQPTREGGFVKKEKVGPIETEYSETIATGNVPDMTAVDALLNPLFNACSNGFSLSVLRI